MFNDCLYVYDNSGKEARNFEPMPLNKEQQFYIECYNRLCDFLLDNHNFTVLRLFRSMTTTLFNQRNVSHNKIFGLALARMSDELPEDSNYTYKKLILEVMLEFSEDDLVKPKCIRVKTLLEDFFEGGVSRISEHNIPLYGLSLDYKDIKDYADKINGIFIKELVLMEQEDSNIELSDYIDRGDFSRALIKDIAKEKLLEDYVHGEIDSDYEGTSFLTWQKKDAGGEVTRHIRLVDSISGCRSHNVYIDLNEYLERLLSNVSREVIYP